MVPPSEGSVIYRGVQLGAGPLPLPASASLAQEAGAPLTVSAWIKPGGNTAAQAIYARRDGASELVLGIENRVPFVQLNGQRSTPAQPVPEGQWAHVALTAEKGALQLYLNGRVVAQLSGALPALGTAPVVGADAPGAAQPLANFEGALDELRISRVAPTALLLADATAQGADSRLISYGADEQSAGQSHFAFILKAMPFDAWVVVAILGLMMLLSWAIMIAKGRHFYRTSKANAVFTESFGKLSGVPLRTLSDMDRQGKAPAAMHDGSLWRIYQVAIDEMQQRHQRDGNSGYLSGATIAAIRASMDAVMVREQEAMARRMNWLSTTIEGAPYVGLFGTVIGIMLVFVVAAMAGAVDINSVAPGMAAALLCTAAGLGVAIPALFGYNYLGARAEAIGADMAVFIDEFAARLAEEQDGAAPRSRAEERAMGQKAKFGIKKREKGINVTPFVDVLLVVLVIFILTSNASIPGIEVNLPKASNSVALEKPKTKAITIDPSGQVFLDAYPVTMAELEDRLRTERATTPDFPVIVRGDAQVQYARVVEVLDLLRRLELAQVGLVTGKAQG